MLLGAMNHPARDPVGEIRWIAEMGLEFVDLTLEPPGAGHGVIDVEGVAAALHRYRLGIVGHTAFYLPLGSPMEEVRAGAVRVFEQSLEVFGRLGVCCMNIHPDFRAPMHDREFSVQQNLRSIRELLPTARRLGICLMVENLPRDLNDVPQLARFLDAIPELGLHLDIGHTNLMVPHTTTPAILERFAHRLRHVHLHDNRGSADDHLPLGAGTLDLADCLRALKRSGYDATITLEVFTPDTEYLRYSAEKVRRLWGDL